LGGQKGGGEGGPCENGSENGGRKETADEGGEVYLTGFTDNDQSVCQGRQYERAANLRRFSVAA
jgi:hypothetical protein